MSDSNRGYNPEMIDELKRLATLKGWPHKRGACTKEKVSVILGGFALFISFTSSSFCCRWPRPASTAP